MAVTLTSSDSRFWDLFDERPDDPDLREEACWWALRKVNVPLKEGRWRKYDVRVYYDDGPMGSGYLLVHWDDSKKVPGCLSNGYCTDPDLRDENIDWEDNPERERALSIRKAIWEEIHAMREAGGAS